MSTKSRYIGGNIVFYESTTAQAVNPMAPQVFHEPFLGAATLTDGSTRWAVVDVANATEARVDDQGGGVFALTLTSASEAQDAVLYMGNERCYDLAAGLIFECRVEAKVIPGSGVTCVFGMAGDHDLDKDTITESAWFRMEGNGDVVVETDDTTNNEDDEATGKTFAPNTYHICRIDCTVIADVRFYIDGDAVGTDQTFDMSNLSTAEAIMQPYFSLDKASGSALGTLYIDDMRIWSNASA